MTVAIHIPPGAAPHERDKYEKIWTSVEEYRDYSPGLVNVDRAMEIIQPEQGSTLIDIGCGGGVAGLAFQRHGMKVWYLDITEAGLVPDVPRDRFIKSPLWAPGWGIGGVNRWDVGFCCDVLEHIPPEYTMLVIDRIVQHCGIAWFQISNLQDQFGANIGMPLHLTVQPYAWWLSRIAEIADVKVARDLCGESLFVVRAK